ncbi:MAG: LacI family DNA-binding transcriptional regulator, partial [Clostridia bacterium]|nr:LacI family DNA-binding transcriptional regulator [Clostridia bacterium]
RFRVKKAIDEVRNSPNQYARSLVTKQKGIIGVVRNGVDIDRSNDKEIYSFDVLPDTYLSDMLDYIVSEIRASEYSVLLDWVCWLDDVPDSMWRLPRILDDNRIDGLLWASGCMVPQTVEKLARFKFPVVLVGARASEYDWVDTSPENGITMAVDYFAKRGHRDIAFINGPGFTQTSPRKLSGFLGSMQNNSLRVKDDWLETANFSGQGGYEAMRRIIAAGTLPTAIVTAQDAIAVGALRCIYENGLSCPRDISIIGYEDGLLAEYAYPPLTTICSRKSELGRTAARVLLNRIENPNVNHVRMIIDPYLVERASVRSL